jgi:hypothetical protein
MPEKLIHCRTCRTLLNTDLEPDSVEIPQFMPLQEIESVPQLPIRGYYTMCPQCSRELRINRKFLGKQVTCKHCSGEFLLDFDNPKIEKVGVYVYCPHCSERLRMSCKYIGIKVACKDCQGTLTVVED